MVVVVGVISHWGTVRMNVAPLKVFEQKFLKVIYSHLLIHSTFIYFMPSTMLGVVNTKESAQSL